MQIQNKTAVVTGATGGIGLAIARALIQHQARCVAIVDISDHCKDIADQLNEEAGKQVAIGYQGDVTDSAFRQSVFNHMQEQHDTISICVPAAGILRDALAVKLDRQSGETNLYDEELFRQVLNVNLMHPVYWAMQTLAGIVTKREQSGAGRWQPDEPIQGSIVLIGSVSSRGNRGQISYACAKSGLNAACKTLNLEGMFHGVQTKIVHPGMVDTPMVEQLPDGHFEEHVKHLIPLGRLIQPEEIARGVVALIENPVISGTLWADGAMMPMS